jgi:hypothetical protein
VGTTGSVSDDVQTTDALRGELDDQRDEMGRTLEAIGDKVSPRRIVERGRDATTGRVRRAVSSARDRVMGPRSDDGYAGGNGDGGIGGLAASAGSQVRSAEDAVLDTTRSNAVAAGAVAFGIGFVAAMAFPRSRVEQRAAEQVRPQLERAAEEVGHAERQVVEEMKPALQEGVEEVKDVARSTASSSAS